MNLQEKKKLLLGKGMKTEDQSDFAHAARMAAKEGKTEFEFQGKTYPVTVDEDEHEDLEEQYIYESDSQLPAAIMDSAYATDDKIFTRQPQTNNISLNKNYGYINPSNWSNGEGFIHSVYSKEERKQTFNIPFGTPIFALNKASQALNKVNFSGQTSWKILIGKIPNNAGNRSKYDKDLINGYGFILDTKDKSDQNFADCTKALISAGFTKISWDVSSGYIGCAIDPNASKALKLASTEKADSARPGHPVYHLHKEKIAGYREGRHILFHRDSYGNLPQVRAAYIFTRTTSLASQVDLDAKLTVKKSYQDRENDIFGKAPHFKDYKFSISDLNKLAKNPKSSQTDEQKDFVQSYGLVSATAAAPVSTGIEVTMPEPEDDFDGEEVIKKGEGILNQIQRLLNLGTSAQTIWNTVSNAAVAIAGFTVRNRVPLSISGVLALAIAGPFLFRLYLKNRQNIQNTRRNMNDAESKKLIQQELGFDVKELKKNMTDKELKALIQSIEKEEMRDPTTRRLYDL